MAHELTPTLVVGNIQEDLKATKREVVIVYAIILIPAVTFVTLITLGLCGYPVFPATVMWVAFAMYVLRILGISIGEHRGGTHEALKSKKGVKYFFLGLASTAFQGKHFNWWTDHRNHHDNPDIPCLGTSIAPSFIEERRRKKKGCDRHTPLDGFWHAAYGWLVKKFIREANERWAKADEKLQEAYEKSYSEQNLANLQEIAENAHVARFFDRTLIWWGLAGLVVPALLAALLVPGEWWSWTALWLGLAWQVACVALVNFATAMINSYCHKPGWPGNYKHFQNKDNACNNWWLALLLLVPEAFHWWHHIMPKSANHGVYWWERSIDYSAHVIWLMERVGLVWDVNWTTVKDLELARLEYGKIELAALPA